MSASQQQNYPVPPHQGSEAQTLSRASPGANGQPQMSGQYQGHEYQQYRNYSYYPHEYPSQHVPPPGASGSYAQQPPANFPPQQSHQQSLTLNQLLQQSNSPGPQQSRGGATLSSSVPSPSGPVRNPYDQYGYQGKTENSQVEDKSILILRILSFTP
ncbi:unnamed protein product [Protopolystoma xenopodis]|uniref:Uncharacterized protein n=1 Tax=Protopolystoma xenopodis TaxID=117903 RepID=A0A3S5AX94_9PLAT|nr:unnamed protein product [Protopolystoma xenopodis]